MAEPQGQRPNVYQVARRAGVSIATVSRVLSGTRPVAPETKMRVLEAAASLKWRPSRIARALAGEKHDAVAIVFPNLSGPYYAEVIRGFEEAAVEHGSATFVLATHGRDNGDEMVRELAERCDGVVIMGRTVSDELVSDLVGLGAPVVVLARPPVSAAPAVRSENRAPSLSLTSHLLEHGRSRLRFLGDPDLSPDLHQRWLGFGEAHRKAGLTAPDEPDACGGFEEEHGYKAALDLLQRDARVDGLVCGNDQLASGAYRAAETSGAAIPGDVAITGWDGIAASRLLVPPLTTVHQPMRELGATACRVLVQRIEQPEEVPHNVTLPTEVVIRSSCGCPSRQGERDET
ncbi:MAG: LacI family DNA-binding transcriptional regulator [Actinomycetota bacterium]